MLVNGEMPLPCPHLMLFFHNKKVDLSGKWNYDLIRNLLLF